MTDSEINATDQIAGAMRTLMHMLVAQGHDPAQVLAAAHAVAVSEIARAFGGAVAADRARAAASQVETLLVAEDAWAEGARGLPC